MKIKLLQISLLTLTLGACNNGSSSNSKAIGPTDPGSGNTVPLIVDGGYNYDAINRPFIALRLCQSGTSNCQIFDHILVDTGSTGLRINQSQISSTLLAALTPITYQNQNVYQCMQYAAGYDFGQVFSADVRLADKFASSISIEIINDGDQTGIPATCTGSTSFANLNEMGAKGIIGINPYSYPDNNYTSGGVYLGSNYTQVNDPTTIPTQLNINPVAALGSESSGFIMTLPSVTGASNGILEGSLILGLNTESNNMISSLLAESLITVVTGSNDSSFPVGFFISSTSAGGVGDTDSIFDSGTPTYYFYSSMQQCTGSQAGFYCPTSTANSWNSTITPESGSAISLAVQIIGYSAIDQSIMPGLGEVASYSNLDLTLYGLTFFFGHSIYVGLMGPAGSTNTPLGTSPVWGYSE